MAKTKAASAPMETSKAATRKRLNLDISMSVYEDVLHSSEENGKNIAEILRIGISLYLMSEDARRKGQSMGIIQGDKIIKEIAIAA
jgi:hypothetical protein